MPMPAPATATITARKTSIIKAMLIHLLPVCAIVKSGARIADGSSLQAPITMKDKRTRRGIRPVASGLLGVLMPFALVSTAQTPTHAGLSSSTPAAAALPVNLENAPAQSPTQPMPYRTPLRPEQVQPLAASFNVATIESWAEQLTYGNRVPGMAMAIVHNGRVLSARGY